MSVQKTKLQKLENELETLKNTHLFTGRNSGKAMRQFKFIIEKMHKIENLSCKIRAMKQKLAYKRLRKGVKNVFRSVEFHMEKLTNGDLP
jgi:hypothetical protein